MTGTPEAVTRHYLGALTDSARWAAFRPRSDDIVVCTPPKSGTTWVQAILALLISGDPEVDAQPAVKSPWIDVSRRDLTEVMDQLEAQSHRRQVKTHTPLDGVPIWPGVRYITIYRHPIDVYFSFRKHAANWTGPRESGYFPESYFLDDPAEGFRAFVADGYREGASLETLVTHYLQTLSRQPRANLIRLHYADMRRDPDAAFQRIAEYVGISHPAPLLQSLMAAARFENMQANATRFVPRPEGFHSAAGFFDSASSGKWLGVLSRADLDAYDARIDGMLSPDTRHWLEWGEAQ